MRTKDPFRIAAIAASILLMGATSTWAQFGKSKPKAKLSLVSSVRTITPGKTFDLGIEFDLPGDWHIYWIDSGDSGLPPRVTWKLPEGLTAGELQFPIPKRHTDHAGITTNIHDGKPLLIVPVTASEALPEGKVTIEASVAYLMCKSICIRDTADLKLTLPVAKGGEPAPDNEDVFAAARRRLPKDTSKVLKVTPSVTADNFNAGAKFDLRLAIEIGERLHVQSHEPLTEGFVPLDVFLEPVEGIMFGHAVYPEPQLRTVPVIGKISEYTGKIVVSVPAEVEETPAAEPLRIAGIVTYQGCNDKGTCFPPDALRFSIDARTAMAEPAGESSREALATPGHTDTEAKAEPDHEEPETAAQADADQQQEEERQQKKIAAAGSSSSDNEEGLEAFLGNLGLPGLLFGCFLYGLFINATPCVLPLLSIKVLGFVQQAHESRRRTLMLGLAFGTGVMIFFVVLGLLAARGTNILQFPVAVIALGAVVMALALSMLGVYTLQVPTAATNLEARIQNEGMVASFGKGALAPVLGFACTGPLLAGAFGWATQQPQHIAVLAFTVMGLGMASPYMLLGANPNWLSFLPKPGNWMITFERIMGFLLLAMVLWLLDPLVAQIGPTGFQWTLAFLVAVAMACWILGMVNISMSIGQRWRYRGGAAALVVIVGGLIYGWISPIARVTNSDATSGDWLPWSTQAVRQAVLAGHPVFVDFTAAWCTECKANKKIAINTDKGRAKFDDCGFIRFRGDFTNGDEKVFAELQKHGRAGVPLNLIYRPGQPDDPIILRPQLTQGYLLEKLDAACGTKTAMRTAGEPAPAGGE